jgi:hypothetical protein
MCWLWRGFTRFFGDVRFHNLVLAAATLAIAIFTSQQVRLTNRLLKWEEYELRYALQIRSTKTIENSWPDSIIWAGQWQNLSKKALSDVLLVNRMVIVGPSDSLMNPLGGWPLVSLRQYEPAQIYSGAPLYHVSKSWATSLRPRSEGDRVRMWLRAYWKTPFGDGYGVAWECEFDTLSGEFGELKRLTPLGRHYSSREILRAEKAQ